MALPRKAAHQANVLCDMMRRRACIMKSQSAVSANRSAVGARRAPSAANMGGGGVVGGCVSQEWGAVGVGARRKRAVATSTEWAAPMNETDGIVGEGHGLIGGAAKDAAVAALRTTNISL